MTVNSTPEEVEQALHDATQALAALKVEKAGLPAAYAAAMTAMDVPAAQVVLAREAEIDLYLKVADVRLRQAKVAAIDVQIEAQRMDAERKQQATDELQAEHDRAKAAGASRLDLDLANVRTKHAAEVSHNAKMRLMQLHSTRGTMVAELEKMTAQLGVR